MTPQGAGPGMLLVQMEPPAAIEEEFHDWYDTEHTPERVAVPGFLTAARFVCVDGWPRYMACYDLETVSVLEGADYRAIGGDNLSVWSKRVLAKVIGRRRFELSRIDDDTIVPPQDGKMLIRFENALPGSLTAAAEALRGRLPAYSVRLFANRLGDGEFVVMIDGPAVERIPELSALEEPLGEAMDTLTGAWRYVRYLR
jgi:hypothetical protein